MRVNQSETDRDQCIIDVLDCDIPDITGNRLRESVAVNQSTNVPSSKKRQCGTKQMTLLGIILSIISICVLIIVTFTHRNQLNSNQQDDDDSSKDNQVGIGWKGYVTAALPFMAYKALDYWRKRKPNGFSESEGNQFPTKKVRVSIADDSTHPSARSTIPISNPPAMQQTAVSRRLTAQQHPSSRAHHDSSTRLDSTPQQSSHKQTGKGNGHAVTGTETIKAKEESDKCTICMDELHNEEKDELRTLPCGHKFHKNCIDRWLGEKSTCPNCRAFIPRTTPQSSAPQPSAYERYRYQAPVSRSSGYTCRQCGGDHPYC